MVMATVPTPRFTPTGITKLICLSVLLTAYSPAAAPLTLTETPFSSTGKAGERLACETQFSVETHVNITSDGASDAVERTMLISPGAKPAAMPGTGLGVGVGLGVGLGAGVAAATGIFPPPAKKDNDARQMPDR